MSWKMPPLLLGSGLMFWGWHTDFLIESIVMAVIVEVPRWISWRWNLPDKDFNRVTDLTSIGMVVVIVYQFDQQSVHAVYGVLELLPYVLFVLLALQLYDTRGGVKLTALFLSVRRAVARGQLTEDRALDLRYPYFAVCLLAATSNQTRSLWLFGGLCVLVAVALWVNRPGRYPVWVWIVAFTAALALAYGGQIGIVKLRLVLEPVAMQWFQSFWRDRSPFRSQTAIGSIGEVKQSDQIIIRVEPDTDGVFPTLLREATYQSFSHNIWIAGVTQFQELEPERHGTLWRLTPSLKAEHTVGITAYLHRGRGLLSVPLGTTTIDNLPVEDLGLNPLGALRINRGPGLISYRAHYDPELPLDLKPVAHDLSVPTYYQKFLREHVETMGLAVLSESDVVNRLRRYFNDEFRYTLDLDIDRGVKPIQSFLEHTKAGHCEYFATATVLLLRAAGIPARYATGYSVQEFSPFENQFVVRRRHAHSWALAFVNGRWTNVDTTPALWADWEAHNAPWWEKVSDGWSWLTLQVSRWRWSEDQDTTQNWLWWLLLPLSVLLAWRLSRQQRLSTVSVRETSRFQPKGKDSDFYQIERVLLDAGFTRFPGETFTSWIGRHLPEIHGGDELLREVLPLHYRYRFDPDDVDSGLSSRLRAASLSWLTDYREALLAAKKRH